MAYIFRLNSEPEGVTVSFTVEDSWSPVISYDGKDVKETMHVIITGDDDDDQADNMQAIHRIQENVRYYMEEPSSQYTQETWLEWQTAGETTTYGPRRRLVKKMDVAFNAGEWFDCGGNISTEIRVTFVLTMAGWWESTGTRGSVNTDLSENLMGMLTFPDLYGDAPTRLANLLIRELAGPTAENIYGAYVAFRSEKRHGDLDNFVPIWELEDASDTGLDTNAHMEAGGSPSDAANNCLETDFSVSATFSGRAVIQFQDVTADFSDNYGRFIVLYRGKVDAATSCTVRVDFQGVTADAVVPSPVIQGTRFTVDNNTTWRMFETGLVVQFPITGTHTAIAIPEQYGFVVSAGRDSGAGSLYSDCLILIPIDEYMIFYRFDSTGKAISVPGGDYVRTYFYGSPDYSHSVMVWSNPTEYVYTVDTPYIVGDGPPPGDGTRAYLLIFTTGTADNTVSGTYSVDIDLYQRYHSLQGAT